MKHPRLLARGTAVLVSAVFALTGQVASADDLTGADHFLCTPIQATLCTEDGECAVEIPWNVNIPQFIEVDLEARRLATTKASGENRETPIEHLRRVEGNIIFHGFEMGRAFSVCLEAKNYMVKF